MLWVWVWIRKYQVLLELHYFDELEQVIAPSNLCSESFDKKDTLDVSNE